MERIDKIMAHPLYVSNQKKIEVLEANRTFCKHGISHSLDVARILYIKVLEDKLPIQKDVIYGVALLHDIGRCLEYEAGKPHHEAGMELASKILIDCGYTEEERHQMVCAIGVHKEKSEDEKNMLCKLLYEADKLSRNCFQCGARQDCYWAEDKKNRHIVC